MPCLLQVSTAATLKGDADQFPGPMESGGFESSKGKAFEQLQDPASTSQTPHQMTEALPFTIPQDNAAKPILSNRPQETPATLTPPVADSADPEQAQDPEVSPAEDKNAAHKPSNGLIAQPDQGAQEEGHDQGTPQPTGNTTSSAARPRSIKTKEQKEALETAFLCASQNKC